MVQGFIIPGSNFKEYLICMDRFVESVHFFQREPLVVKCFNASLVQGYSIIKRIDSILVSPDIKESLPVSDPSVNLTGINFQGCGECDDCIFRSPEIIQGITFLHPDVAKRGVNIKGTGVSKNSILDFIKIVESIAFFSQPLPEIRINLQGFGICEDGILLSLKRKE